MGCGVAGAGQPDGPAPAHLYGVAPSLALAPLPRNPTTRTSLPDRSPGKTSGVISPPQPLLTLLRQDFSEALRHLWFLTRLHHIGIEVHPVVVGEDLDARLAFGELFLHLVGG